jgi:hypothetical protein
MKIPVEDLEIPPAKLTNYLLVHREQDDKSKFLAQAGFTQENWELLMEQLQQIAETGDAVEDGTTEYGTSYLVEGSLRGANDRILEVITVWMRRAIDSKYQFVTLKPNRKSKREFGHDS